MSRGSNWDKISSSGVFLLVLQEAGAHQAGNVLKGRWCQRGKGRKSDGASCWEIRGPPPAPTSLFNTKRVATEEQNREQGKTSAPSKHSRFTGFGLRAYVHGGKGGVYSLPV